MRWCCPEKARKTSSVQQHPTPPREVKAARFSPPFFIAGVDLASARRVNFLPDAGLASALIGLERMVDAFQERLGCFAALVPDPS